MADKWLLQDGSGSWQLQDASGYWILQLQPGGATDVPNTARLHRVESGVVAITAAGMNGVIET